jgi:hypothetical protein
MSPRLWKRPLWAGLFSYSRLSQTLMFFLVAKVALRVLFLRPKATGFATQGCCCTRVDHTVRPLYISDFGSVPLRLLVVLPGTRTHGGLIYDKLPNRSGQILVPGQILVRGSHR